MLRTAKRVLKRVSVVLAVIALLVPFIWLNSGDTKAASQAIVRVKLSMGTPTEMDFSLHGYYGIEEKAESVLSSGSYTVKVSGSSLKLYFGGTLVYTGADINLFEYEPANGDYNYASLPHVNGTRNYLGDIEFKYYSGYIRVINHVYIDYYLYGVVPYEMSNSWPIEALKSQAVAARTYAERYMLDGGGDYDVVDTASNQVYAGFNPSYTTAIQAVDETAKTVLVCDGKLVQTYYAASNGGYVDIPQHVWSSGATVLPYHVLQADPYDTQNTYSSQEVLIFPKTMDGSNGIVYQCASSGSMVTGTGTNSAKAEKYIKTSALSAVAAEGYTAAVTSDIEIVGFKSIVPHTYEGNHGLVNDYTGTNTCVVFTKADVTMTVLASRQATQEEYQQTGQQTVEEQVDVEFTIDMHKFDEDGGIYQAFDNMSLRLFVVTEEEGSWNIYHRRYGHGVGMSQRGAQTRAKAGQTYQEILSFYYPNTTFEALNIAPPERPQLPEQTETGTNGTIINCSTGVNIRKTPDTDYSPVGVASLGERITVTQQYYTATWHQISYNGQTAYIYAYYVLLDPPLPSASFLPSPTISPTESPSETSSPTVSPTESLSESPSPTISPSESPSESASPSVSPLESHSPIVSPLESPSALPSETPSASPSAVASPSASPSPSSPEIMQNGKVNSATLNVRKGPSTSYSIIGTLAKGDTVSIIEIEPVTNWHKIWYKDAVAYVWADYIDTENDTPEITATGIVTSSVLNVRSGPGTSFSITGNLAKGDSVSIIEKEPVNDWHKIWYNGTVAYVWADYVKIGPQAPEIASTGVVTSSILNVRSGPGTSYSKTDTLSKGDTVQIVKLNYSAGWHQIWNDGALAYVYASYVKLNSTEADDPDTEKPVSSVSYASVKTSTLNMRSGAGTSYKIVDTLKQGEVVQVMEKGSSWSKVKYGGQAGYMYASYLSYIDAAVGKVTIASLNVRSGPSSSTTILGKLRSGDIVEIIDKGGSWYKIRYGSSVAYVYASYIKLI